MKYPKLKNARLCRLIPYIVVIGGYISSVVFALNLPVIPQTFKAILFIGISAFTVVYLFRNFMLLMMMDISLAMVSCRNTSRRSFDLTKGRKTKNIEKSFSRYGIEYSPIALQPKPCILRCRTSRSCSILCSGVARAVAVYKVDRLDKNTYHAVFQSANANINAMFLKEKKTVFGNVRDDNKIGRVSVIVIFAKSIEEKCASELYELVCKNGGEGSVRAIVPCVIDESESRCVFNCERLPYVGFGYPVKNRGVRLIRNFIFGGHLPLADNDDVLPPIKDIYPEQSLWAFWKKLKKELLLDDRKKKKKYTAMRHGDVDFNDGRVYVKWKNSAICVNVHIDAKSRKVRLEPINSWDYPSKQKIARRTVLEINKRISEYFEEEGFSCEFDLIDKGE